MLVAPAMVALARGGIFARLTEGPLDLRSMSASAACVGCLFDLLSTTDWVERAGHIVQLTRCGRYAAHIASAYGVTVSYLPMFAVLPTLLFGNARIPRVDPSGFETMVNRAMNVWGGGGAHVTYFKKLDEIIVEIFNRPVSEQPRGICDIELHTLPPALTANLDRTPAVAYDATHGFSDQYLVELPVFADCAREAGLRAEPRWQTKFPPSELATVSLNYFTAA